MQQAIEAKNAETPRKVDAWLLEDADTGKPLGLFLPDEEEKARRVAEHTGGVTVVALYR